MGNVYYIECESSIKVLKVYLQGMLWLKNNVKILREFPNTISCSKFMSTRLHVKF